MEDQPKRLVDFVCPFAGNDTKCPEYMTPIRPAASNREKKLLVMMNKDITPTKNGCPRCDVFINAWREHIGAFGHIKYFMTWFRDKKIRKPSSQELL